VKRREFIAGLAGATAWPVVARAQQTERVRRIGGLFPLAEDDPLQQAWVKALHDRLERLGWQIGRNLRVDYRWAAGDADRMRVAAAELVGLAPDLLLGGNTPTTAALQRETRSIPIVFLTAGDPVLMGFVSSFARPGGNMTGFMSLDFSVAGKQLELMRILAPAVRRIAVMFDPAQSGRYVEGWLREAERAAVSPGFEITVAHVQSSADIESTIDALADRPGGGMLVVPDTTTSFHRGLIAELAAVHRVPALYSRRYHVVAGGLASYGNNVAENYRQGADYVDRILKGDKPSDLPVQAPTRFELVINLKAAEALGLTIPETLLATADEVIQ
jgi:putative tryptophan/tyrosine transport system substrate-binding protein